jgi:hypothetical protein
MVLSIGIFFSLIILGLAGSLSTHLVTGLTAQGVPVSAATQVSKLPPTAVMFAALLGYNPIQMLLGPVLAKLPASHAAFLTGHSFFPSLIAAPFAHGLDVAFDFAIVACLIAAVASLLRGKRYVHEVHAAGPAAPVEAAARAEGAAPAEAAAPVEAAAPLEAATPVAADARKRSALRLADRDGRVELLDVTVGPGDHKHRGEVPGA